MPMLTMIKIAFATSLSLTQRRSTLTKLTRSELESLPRNRIDSRTRLFVFDCWLEIVSRVQD